MSRSRRCFQRAGSVSSWPPPVGRGSWGLMPLAARHTNFADEGGARVTSRCSPDWRAVTLAGLVLNLAGEVGDQVGSLCQVVAPDGMVMQQRWWNAGEPGQRTWAGMRELWETPVKDGGHVAGSAEVASAGGIDRLAALG